MNLKNRTFKNNLTGDVVTVIDSFENIVILDDRTKVSPLILLNPNLYTEISLNESVGFKVEEEVDVNNFFSNQNAYSTLADKIKNIPPDQMGNNNESVVSTNINVPHQPTQQFAVGNDVAIYETTEESEKEALARKYGIAQPDINSLNKQNEAFNRLLGDEAELPIIPIQQVFDTDEPVQRIEVQRDSVNINGQEQEYTHSQVIQPQPAVEDPIIRMFKGVKRNLNFSVNIELTDRIPRVDFIEMMEDSYETSIIEFLADEFTDKILSDPEKIRTIIKDKIKKMVYSSEWTSSDLAKKKTPIIKGTLSVEKPVSIDIDNHSEIPNVEAETVETESIAPKKKRIYKKKNEVTNG